MVLVRVAKRLGNKFLFVRILLVVTVLTSFVICDDEAQIAQKAEESQRPLKGNPKEEELQKPKSGDRNKFERHWGDRIAKSFFYGKKFELNKQSGDKGNKGVEEGKLISPLITSPIRALPLKSQVKRNWSSLQKNQNDILNSVRDSLSESNGGNFNKSYFAEDVNETENIGGEASGGNIARNSEDGWKENLSSNSKQDSDKSLVVVLPFKAENGNMEELFTKKPLVHVLDSSENSQKEIKNIKETTESTTTATKAYSRKRWRPYKVYRTTTEAPVTETTTTEDAEEATKTYTNYNDVEQVTRKFDMYGKYSGEDDEENHNYEDDLLSQHKFDKELTQKTPFGKEPEIDENVATAAPLSSIENLDFITEKKKETSTFKPRRKGQRWKLTSTEGPPKPEDLGKVLEILPPDMKQIFEQMELNKDNKEPEIAHKNVYNFKRLPQPTIDPKSYAKFRPIPLDRKDSNRNFISDEMKNLLESFGLLSNGNRAQKSLSEKPPETESKSVEEISGENLEFLTDDLKSVLRDMGLLKNDGRKEPTRIHIFNPSNHTMGHTDEERIKLNAILSSIKTTVNNTKPLTPESQGEIIQKIKELDGLRYKSRNLTEVNNEIQKIVDENKFVRTNKPKTTKRATKLLDGPDPVYFAEESLLKNDVKRQDSSNASSSSSSSASSSSSSSSSSASSSSSSSSASSSSSDSDTPASSDSESESESSATSQDDDTTTTTTTEENSNLEALRQSFGGGETAPDDADIESALPPKKPNGLYFLFDWNSFFEVGGEEDGDRRVQLRFQPKAGDPRNFLSVTVP